MGEQLHERLVSKAWLHAQAPGSGSGSGVKPIKYREVPNFLVSADSTETRGVSKEQCAAKCTIDSKCNSFSYALRDPEAGTLGKICVISQNSLAYDQDFTTKVKKGKKTIKRILGYGPKYVGSRELFYTFPGLTMDMRGWTRHPPHESLDKCEKTCIKDKKCRSLAFRKRDKICITGVDKMYYSKVFNYYEKKPSKVHIPIYRPPKGSGSGLPGKWATGIPNNPLLMALEMKEKDRMKAANAKYNEAETAKAMAKATVQKLKLQAKEEIAAAKNKDKGKLSKIEKAIADKANETMGKKQSKDELEFASSEGKTKAKQVKNKTSRENEREMKAAEKLKSRAEKEGKKALADDRKASIVALDKLDTANAQKDAKSADAKASEKAGKAKVVGEGDKEKAEKLKAKGKADEAAEKKKLMGQKEKEDMNSDKYKEKLSKQSKKDVKAVQKEEAGTVKEMAKKAITAKTERGVKTEEQLKLSETAKEVKVKAKEEKTIAKSKVTKDKVNADMAKG